MQNIDSDLIRGNIDTIILKTMLNEDKYGLDIIKEVEQRSSGTYELKQPTLYSCLKRLENQELISSYWVNSEIGGRRHYYKLTDKGRDFYNKKQEEWAKSKFVIDNLLSSYNYEEYRLVKKDEYDKVMNQELPDDNETAENQIDALKTTESDDEMSETASEELSYDEDNSEAEDDLEAESEFEEINDFEESPISSDSEPESEEIENDFEENIQEDVEDTEFSDYDLNEDNNAVEDDIDEELDDSNSMVYVNHGDDNDENSDNDEENGDFSENQVPDQTENEANILNMLRLQKKEEINTYEGDKKSYANQIKSIYNDVKYVQDDMTFVGHEEHDEVDQKIKDWTDAATKLDEFENSLHGNNDTDNYDNENNSGTLTENDEDIENFEDNNELNFSENDNDGVGDETFDFEENIPNNDFDENIPNNDFEDNDIDEDFTIDENEEFSNSEDEGGLDFQEEPDSNELETTDENDNNYSDFDFNADEDEELDLDIDTQNSEDDEQDYSHENYNDYSQVNTSFFASGNESYQNNDFETNQTNIDADNNDNFAESYNYSPSEPENNDFQPNQFASYQNSKFNQDEYDRTFVNVHKDTQDFIDNSNNDLENSDIDSIISKNVTSKSRNSDNNFYERRYIDENYKQKLSNLTVYSRAASDKPIEEKTQKNENTQADDLDDLKASFEREGIKVKEHKKLSNSEEVEKNYLLVNKINLIKSLILLFCFGFTLSGMYLVLKNTSFAFISEDFKFTSFLIGLIPFAILVLYHLIVYIISPYKKVPARFASRIMIFLSVIVTVQLLLITYCVNLQLGFYSFTQAGYNHLLWVIPTTISFGPIISNIIYAALFYSENFNV